MGFERNFFDDSFGQNYKGTMRLNVGSRCNTEIGRAPDQTFIFGSWQRVMLSGSSSNWAQIKTVIGVRHSTPRE